MTCASRQTSNRGGWTMEQAARFGARNHWRDLRAALAADLVRKSLQIERSPSSSKASIAGNNVTMSRSRQKHNPRRSIPTNTAAATARQWWPAAGQVAEAYRIQIVTSYQPVRSMRHRSSRTRLDMPGWSTTAAAESSSSSSSSRNSRKARFLKIKVTSK